MASKTCADEDNSCYKVELGTHGGNHSYFQVLGGFKYKKEGDIIHYNDQVLFKHLETAMFMHVTERLLKIENLEGPVASNLIDGVNIITPKPIDRREPPNLYVPYLEINVSQMKTKFQVQIFRYHDEDPNDQFIKGGMVVRLIHSEQGGVLHSDDKDFTDDGMAEVYLWNFKGKMTDIEAMSSSSLFEIEYASELSKAIQKHPSTPKDNQAIKTQDENTRFGKVFRYSSVLDQDDKEVNNVTPSDDDIDYRLRHLNTGRLVIDQEICYNGVQIKTLGLSPHI